MHTMRYILPYLLITACMNVAFGADIELNGTIAQTIPLHGNQGSAVASNTQNNKPIVLFNVKLSQHAHQLLKQRAQKTINAIPQSTRPITAQTVKLGMGQVPVLDQGQHGTCVTFAVSAALDAALGEGDAISQLCSLQLGSYLSNHGYRSSGWDGAWAEWILAQFNTFGAINKTTQTQYGCGGVTYYPKHSIPQSNMSIEDYHRSSYPLQSRVAWSSILDIHQVFADQTDMEQALTAVKHALQRGHRVTLGVLLPQAKSGTAGAVGWHRYFNDTWVFTPAMQDDLTHKDSLPGHEMVITGYADEAVASDFSGQKHYGLLTLRNSWGYFAGDWGNFYMSYDYFKTLAIEAVEIIPLDNKSNG